MYQWYLPTVKAEYIYSLSRFRPWPHFPTLYLPFSNPHFWQTLASLELSFSIRTYEPHEAGWTFVWPLKYRTTSSPALLVTVVTWNVRPLFLLQWNLSWVKDKCVLNSLMAVFVRTIWSLVIPRYEVLTGSWEGGVEPITTLETRSHPPEMESCFLIRKNNLFKRYRYNLEKNWPGSRQCLFSLTPRQIFIILYITLMLIQ